MLISQMAAPQREVSLPEEEAAGRAVQGSRLTLPKLWEREERVPDTGTTICSRQDSPQVLRKQPKTHLVSSSWLASLERLEL